MLDLATPIEKLPKVGPRNLPRIKKLGIKTIRDLLWHFPTRYEDYSLIRPISSVNRDENVNIQGRVVKIDTQRSWKKRLTITHAIIEDDSAAIRAVWFNRPYIAETLSLDSEVSLAGKVKLDKNGLFLASPSFEKITSRTMDQGLTHTGRLVPVYPETYGITSKYLRFLIRPLLPLVKDIPDPLPAAIAEKYNLPSLGEAIARLHFPTELTDTTQAKKRIAFDELLLFQLKSIISRRQLMKLKAPSITFNSEQIKSLVSSLPFELTDDQRLCSFEILKDIEKSYPMNRLLNGDVGSGKTVVALLAAYQAATQGHQSVFMVPTEILAHQHFKNITTLLKNTSLRIGLLTGSKAKQWPIDAITEEEISKKMMLDKIDHGGVDIVIGTHAVIQKGVQFKNLALVIIDEQHRFGVQQRMALVKQEANKAVPHLLSMTATPIPRTLALTIYGDLDISLIKEKPKNRKKIITKVVNEKEKRQAYQFIDQEINAGRQVFVICPRIELSNPQDAVKTRATQNKMNILWAEVKAVTEEYEKLSKDIFPHRRIVMLHGKMKPAEKEKIMADFKNNLYDIMVATSVVEVGIDIPNASVMFIENAERFGLAQLHQFRGRVGRAEHQSHCLLINGGNQQFENRRLKALENYDDGFKLAEQDLQLRGPGEFVGTKQSGIPDLAMASLTDLDLIKKARLEAKLLLKSDPGLKDYPLLRANLAQFQKIRHFE
ncbi:MAG: ATP-dependent DNA helicase RecG [bacterium]|nr:ATP-dependent DNA helicase RecG [bacterium]